MSGQQYTMCAQQREMFNKDELCQMVDNDMASTIQHDATRCILFRDGENIVKVEQVGLDDSYNYLSYGDGDAAANGCETADQYVTDDDVLHAVSEMQVDLAETPSPLAEEHVEVVRLVDDTKDSRRCKVSGVSRDARDMEYDVSNVIMVSMDEDDHSSTLSDMNRASSTVNTADANRSEPSIGDYLTQHKNTTSAQSSNAVGIKTNKGYYCSKCKRSFNMKRHFLNHLQLHFKNKEFECTECGERFYQRHCLELHRVTHLDVRKSKAMTTSNKYLLFECKLCRTRFSSLGHLKNHINLLHRCSKRKGWSHLNLAESTGQMKPEVGHHICYHCQNIFNDKKTFSKHIKLHSLNFECIACPKKLDSKQELKVHNWTHFSFYSCSVCKSMFKSTKELTRHEGMCLSHLLSDKDLAGVVGGDKPSVCDVCGDVFVKKQEFQKHLNRHVKRFRCRQCGSGYHSQAALDDHEKFHEFNSHMYKCSDCPKSFYSLPLLQGHQKKHTADNQQCSICKEVFKSEEQRHKHKHLFLGNVKCDLCSIQCSGSHGLNMHKRLAHPEAQYKLGPKVPKKSSEQIIVCLEDVVEYCQ